MKTALIQVLIAVLLLCLSTTDALKEKATGIAFADTRNGLDLFGVGVRKKGPIKIYGLACYGSPSLKSTLAEFGKKDEKEALKALQSGAKQNECCFFLQMSFKVGAEKMASAIADSVSPRHKGSKSDVDELKTLLLDGINAKSGAATKGTTFCFACSKDGVQVSLDGKELGTVNSSSLAQSFCDVYLDDKAVSPSLRKSILENCCANE